MNTLDENLDKNTEMDEFTQEEAIEQGAYEDPALEDNDKKEKEYE
jgi:hypothetical protein